MRIFLIRHGESVGNIDESAFEKYENYYIPLTRHGARQVDEAGAFLDRYLSTHPGEHNGKVDIWFGPFRRVVQTKNGLAKHIRNHVENTHEHYLLREKFHGVFDNIRDPDRQVVLLPEEFAAYSKEREEKGDIYARPPGGESLDDVAKRTHRFLEKYVQGDKDVVIVCHGAVATALERELCQRDDDWLIQRKNEQGFIKNANIRLLEGDRERGFNAETIFTAPERNAETHPSMSAPYGGPFPERRAMTAQAR